MSKNPPHRPRKLIKKIWQGADKILYKEQMLELASRGAHQEELLEVLPIGRDSFYDLIKKEKETPELLCEEELDLAETIKRCYTLRKNWWTKNLRDAAFNDSKHSNATLICFYMKNAFREEFKDRLETTEKQVIIQDGATEGFGLDDE